MEQRTGEILCHSFIKIPCISLDLALPSSQKKGVEEMDGELLTRIEKMEMDLNSILGVVILIENDSYMQQTDGVIHGATCIVHEKLLAIKNELSIIREAAQK